jgi:hypothetical protein
MPKRYSFERTPRLSILSLTPLGRQGCLVLLMWRAMMRLVAPATGCAPH